MDPIFMQIMLGVGAGLWFLVCVLIYRSSRDAAWLAGSTVAACLFFLGATVLASIPVNGALLLLPLWLGILMLSLLHLRAARQRTAAIRSGRAAGAGSRTHQRFSSTAKDQNRQEYL
jgi:hypothetical protein